MIMDTGSCGRGVRLDRLQWAGLSRKWKLAFFCWPAFLAVLVFDLLEAVGKRVGSMPLDRIEELLPWNIADLRTKPDPPPLYLPVNSSNQSPQALVLRLQQLQPLSVCQCGFGFQGMSDGNQALFGGR